MQSESWPSKVLRHCENCRPSLLTEGYLVISVFSSVYFSLIAKEEEKQKLMKWSSELKLEREQLEQRVKQLSNSITVNNCKKAVRQDDIDERYYNN